MELESMSNSAKRKPLIPVKLKNEIKLFWIYTAFLTVYFSMFNIYERILLSDFTNKHIPYGYSIIEALILAKFIIIGDSLKIGKKIENMPLIYPVMYKTIFFCFIAFAFLVLEHYVHGYLHGKSFHVIYVEVLQQHINLAFAKISVIFFVFLLFFSLNETARVVGKERFIHLFFRKSPLHSKGVGGEG